MIRVLFLTPIILATLTATYFGIRAWVTYASRRAQERREQAKRDLLVRTSQLEHDLGYRPCSVEGCWDCVRWADQERMKKNQILGQKHGGFLKNDPLLSTGMLDYDIDVYYDYGKRAYVINTKKDGMAQSNIITEATLQAFEHDNYAMMQRLVGGITRPERGRTSSGGPK